MRLTLLLQRKDGEQVGYLVRDFPEIHCRSDANQKLPRFVLMPVGTERVFTFKNLLTNGEDGAVFVERELLCVSMCTAKN
jgi:hypothetical protein